MVVHFLVTDEQHWGAKLRSGTGCKQKYEHINNNRHIRIHTCSIRRQTPTENPISLQLGVCAYTHPDWTYYPRAVWGMYSEKYTFLIYRQRQEIRKEKREDEWAMMPSASVYD